MKSLSEQAINKQYKFKRLYRNLYNPEFYFLAYKNISQSQGSMTPGVDGKSLDGMSEKRINALIESLKDFSYQPNPARRVYIEKKNSTKKRPLGIPSTEDKLVQEVVKMILESIYEPNFSECSHGFRPKRSCHSALQQIQNQFTGITWFIEGDIHACFDSFDHHVLVDILRERIQDENFLALIWKMLKAGYMEQWVYNCTFSGTPQGSGVSPILANIYLSKLDDFAENLKKSFDKGKSKDNLEYQRAASKLFYIRRRNRANWENWNEQQRKEALRLQKDAINCMHSLPSKRANNEKYKSLVYCRYADDFLIGVIGSFEDASEIKEKFRVFLEDTLHLEMSEEKTKITQGGVISPLLSGLYMHYAFDRWITREFPMCKWERYADDGIIHCVSRKQAEYVLDMLKERMQMCGLEIHPEKSKIVYCQRNNEKIDGKITSFTFLGYCFRPRLTKSRSGQYFMGFTPAVSAESATAFRQKIRLEIQNSKTTDIVALSKRLNPIIRGWYNYFGKYCPSEAFRKGINYVNLKLVRWLEGTRKSVRRSLTKAQHLLHRIAMSNPEMFYHWKVGYMPVK